MWRRVQTVAGVVVLGGALAVAPVAVSSATNHKPPKHKVVKHKKAPPKTTKTLSCSGLNGFQNKSDTFGTSLAQAFESGNPTSIKQALTTEIGALNQAISTAEKDTNPPANVKAAFTTIANAFKQMASAVQNAQTLPEIETSLQGFDTASVKSASQTLTAYYDSYCGISTTTTSST
jgi:hypothetical protein